MGISVLSWIVPFIKINIVKEPVISAPKVLYFADVIADKNSSLEQEVVLKSSQFSWDNLILFIAICISLLFIIRFVKSLWNIRRFIKLYPVKHLANLFLVMTDVKGTPFSFFKYIFWNVSIDLSSEVGKKVLAHEVAHVEENHSFDKLLIELQLVISWFNPITWLIRNELYLIHEFIADQKAIQNNDTSILAELLLVASYPSQQHILSNSFFYSPIKRRIQMFTKSSNTKYSYLRRLAILPIMAATVLLFAFRNGKLNSRPIIKLDKQYTVIIDAGHGGEDLGASAVDGTTEKDLALAIALKLKSINNNPNINIVLTRESDRFLNVVDRANIANASNANLFVSIHMDNASASKFSGTTCYIPSKNKIYTKESNLIAKNLIDATSEMFPKSKITTREKGIWVLENVKMPSVLFESGYISNPNDLSLVKANEEKIANMLLDGIEYYLANENQLKVLTDTVKSVNVLKGESALAKKSADGKNGAVDVVLKDKGKSLQSATSSSTNLSNNTKKQYQLDKVVLVSYKDDNRKITESKPLYTLVSMHPIFNNIEHGWAKYLERTLDRDLPKRRGAPIGQYIVTVSFEVDQDGKVVNVSALNDPGYGTAEEAIRIIESSPKWTPGIQNGSFVKYSYKQDVEFKVVEN
jgi:N-acetylmuramoyl-L-alanine amidase